jgi:hypothetical protein
MASEIPHWHDVDPHTFMTEILPAGRPAVLKGLVADWPLVRRGLESAEAVVDYFQLFDAGTPVEYLTADASLKGRFSYNESMTGTNFRRVRAPLNDALRLMLAGTREASPPALSIQALSVRQHLPELPRYNSLGLLAPQANPTMWINNATTIAAHYDCMENIACVVAGRRRFTLFPPEQLKNLYIGPLHSTPQGVPISLVDVTQPDLQRFPKFAAADAAAQTAELGPGDAIFIPYMWWHAVQSLAPFNILVNYWWNLLARSDGPPYTALMHAIIAVGSLPPEQRAIWQQHFEHFVFHSHGDPGAHITPEGRGVLGPMTPEQVKQVMGLMLKVMNAEQQR